MSAAQRRLFKIQIAVRNAYDDIPIAGGDTAQPLCLAKRLAFLRPYLAREKTRFFDGGCGVGDYVFRLVDDEGMDAYGVEYEHEKVRRGQAHPQHGFRISRGDLQALELLADDWDYAMLNEVLEHVPDEGRALGEIHRILKPGGLLFVFSPNRWFPFETHGIKFKRSGRPVPPWFPFVPYLPLFLGRHWFSYWARNYWQGELRNLIASAGFSIVKTSFVWQTFEGISGRQPRIITALRSFFRTAANTLETVPLLRRFGVSQFLVCQKIPRLEHEENRALSASSRAHT